MIILENLASILILLLIGAVGLTRPHWIQRRVIAHYESWPELSRFIPFREWFGTTGYIVTVRAIGVLALALGLWLIVLLVIR